MQERLNIWGKGHRGAEGSLTRYSLEEVVTGPPCMQEEALVWSVLVGKTMEVDWHLNFFVGGALAFEL